MSNKSKGINAERELIHMFWAKEDWAAIRIAGSGSSRYPSADVIASNAVRRLAIESKVTKDNSKYFTEEEINDFKEYCRRFGAEAWIAIKFTRTPWYFLSLEDLEHTSSNLSISISLAEKKGLSFEQLIGKF
jgi:holliday junction resolvase Hjr